MPRDRARTKVELEVELVGLRARLASLEGQPDLDDPDERERLRAALRDSELLVQQIAATVPSIVYVFDVVEQRNVYVNYEVERTLGYTPGEIQALERDFRPRLMHPEDLARLPERMARLEAARDGQVLELEYRMRHASGEYRWLHGREIVFSRTSDGRPRQVLGVAHDVTEARRAQATLQESEELLRRHYAELVALGTSRAFVDGSFDDALAEITQTAARALDVERVGVWFFDEERRRLQCAHQYVRSTGAREPCLNLLVADYPVFFRELEKERMIAAHDARSDTRTCELLETYLQPFGITSMVDAPIRSSGRVVGVICHEHTGPPRRWRPEEEALAGSMADFAALALARRERRRTEELQTAVYRIARAEATAKDLDGLLGQVHAIVAGVLPARNFYVALYDAAVDWITFPYWQDERDPRPAPRRPAQGKTEYVLRTGRPLVCDAARHEDLESRGKIRTLGTKALYWLGVPLIVEGRTIGVMAVRSYEDARRYGRLEQAVLVFVSAQVARAVDRMQAAARRRAVVAQQAAVAALGQSALARSDLSAFMHEVVQVVAGTLCVEMVRILEYLPGREALLLRAGVGWKPGLVGQATVGAGSESQAGFTLRARAPVVVDDLSAETRFEGPQLLKAHGVVSGMSCVVPGPDRPFGVLGAHTRTRRHFDADETQFLQSVANLLAAAVERHRILARVRQSEERYRVFFDGIPHPVCVVDVESMAFLAANDAACHLYGYTRDELLRMTPLDLHAPEGIPAFLETFHKPESGPRWSQGRHRRKDGTPIDVEIDCQGIRLGERTARLAIVTDVTHRRRVEARLAAEHGVARVLAGVQEAGVVPGILPPICTTLGFALGELWEVDPEGDVLRPLELWHDGAPELAEFAAGTRALALERGAGLAGRVWARGSAAWLSDIAIAPDVLRAPFARALGLHGGCAVPVAGAGQAMGALVCLDREPRAREPELLESLTAVGRHVGLFLERRRAELALRAREDRYRALFESAAAERDRVLQIVDTLGQGVLVLDREWRFEYANPAFARMVGRDPEDILGRTPWDFADRRDVAVLDEAAERRSRGLGTTYEVRLQRPDGVVTHALVTGVPRMRAGVVEGSIAVVADLSEHRRTEARLLVLESQQRQLEREARQGILEARIRERAAVARQLHEGLGQSLAGLSMTLAAKDHGDLAPEVEQARRAVAAARLLSQALLPPELDVDPLARVVSEYLGASGAAGAVAVTVRSRGEERCLDAEQKFLFYDLAREVVACVRDHTGATKLQLDFAWRRDGASLHARHDGADSAAVEAAAAACLGIRDRAELLSGGVVWQRAASGANVIAVHVPRPARAPARRRGARVQRAGEEMRRS